MSPFPPHYVVLEKPVGHTPLQAIQAWKAARPEYADLPMSYAGRLDPMASGKLLVLIGEECKRQKEYTKLDKRYEIEVLLGAGSDTGDALGIIETSEATASFTREDILKALRSVTGSHTVPYPAYSSKTVGGTPLFLHALQGTLPEMLPVHEETVFRATLAGVENVAAPMLQERIASFLAKTPRSTEPSKVLGADFRIDAVQASWNHLFSPSAAREFQVLSLTVDCASGTYMRTLAGRIGEALGTEALALSIHRSKIGNYVKLGGWGFWGKEYR